MDEKAFAAGSGDAPLLSAIKAYVVTDTRRPERVGTLNVVARGTGQDLLLAITCADGSRARVWVRDKTGSLEPRQYPIVIRAPGLDLTPAADIGHNPLAEPTAIDVGHLTFSPARHPGRNRLPLVCSLRFARGGTLSTRFLPIRHLDDLVQF